MLVIVIPGWLCIVGGAGAGFLLGAGLTAWLADHNFYLIKKEDI